MATIEELQEQIAALSARVDALTVPPNRYYSSRYTGETIDKLLTSISGGAANLDLSNLTDYQRALHNVGAMPGNNFVDNARFAKGFIVNQVGQTSYTGDFNNPCIDRWRVWGTVTLEDDGIAVQNQADVVEFMCQNISDEYLSYLRGKQVTMSVVYQESGTRKISSVTFVVSAQGDIDSPEIDINGILFDLYKTSNIPYARYRFFYLGGSSVQIKLEAIEVVLGDHQTIVYTDDTGNLQFISPGNYEEELSRCQRFSLFGPLSGYPVIGGYIRVPTPVTMRTQPVFIGLANVYRENDNTYLGQKSLTVTEYFQNAITVNIADISDRVYVVIPQGSGFSADL